MNALGSAAKEEMLICMDIVRDVINMNHGSKGSIKTRRRKSCERLRIKSGDGNKSERFSINSSYRHSNDLLA